MLAPTERRARSTMRSLHGNPISRCCCALVVPHATASIHAGTCASASSPSLAGGASVTWMAGIAASTDSRSSRYFDIGNGCPAGSGSTKVSEWKARTDGHRF
jgi:hypothetical protein